MTMTTTTKRPWYAPDRRIRTKAAAVQAERLADAVHRGHVNADEHDLFVALHTCAYRIQQAKTSKASDLWIHRWRDLREYLVTANIGLAHFAVQRQRSDVDADVLLSESLAGLVSAVERFDPWRGFRFSTYAVGAIHRRLWRAGQNEHRHRERFPVQYDAGHDRPMPEADPRLEWHQDRLRHVLGTNSAGLTPMERMIIRKRFPHNGPADTFMEIGTAAGLSKERIRQIQVVALGKLRQELDADPVLA